MSAGAVFALIANDGKADRMIMATELLNARIRDIMCYRKAQGLPPTPTLVDIERTHLLFVNAHFKPFAAIGFEYNNVQVAEGASGFGVDDIKFQIPQFGDFFNDMVIKATIDPISASAGTVPKFPPIPTGATLVSETDEAQISSKDDTVAGVYTRYTREYVDFAGNVLEVASPATNFVRYCDYPGVRLFTEVKFDVNGNPLDSYRTEAVLFYQKFRIPPNKVVGWKRLVGQQVPVEAVSDSVSIDGSSSFSAETRSALGLSSASLTARKIVSVVSGPQTPKAQQPKLEMWIPLIFWFNRDVRLSIPSVSIPYGQRYIIVSTAEAKDIAHVAPGNLFLSTTVEQFVSDNGTGAGTASQVQTVAVNSWTTLTPVLAEGSTIDYNAMRLKLVLHINNIFVNPEVHDIYIKRIGFSLIRCHLRQREVFETNKELLLSNLKWPIETIFLGFRPDTNKRSPDNWHRFSFCSTEAIDQPSRASATVIGDPSASIANNVTAHTYFTTKSHVSAERLLVPVYTETFTSLKLKAHGIDLYKDRDTAFYRDYMPFVFGGANLNTPDDIGACMINFCLFPGTYQPSGHLNVSRVRELYIEPTMAPAVSTQNQVVMELVAITLNFILISDGSAVLRYST